MRVPGTIVAKRVARRTHLGIVLGLVNRPDVLVSVYGGTDKGEHGYMPFYRHHLKRERLRRRLVFEIGVGGYESQFSGGSPAVWRDYLLFSTVVGIDIHEKARRFGRRVHFRQADQNQPSDLLKIVREFGPPNIVIDDGSHVGEHIWTSFRTLWPIMPADSLYVVEDLSTSYYPEYGGGSPPRETTGVGLAQRLADDVQALDSTFVTHPGLGSRDPGVFDSAAEIHVYPGLFFVRKVTGVATPAAGTNSEHLALPGDRSLVRTSPDGR
jgi:hypothetical protein